MMANRILIVDDHPVVRRGLSQLFEGEADFSVCGEAATVAQALDAVGETTPDIVLCDLMLEGRNGLELTNILKAQYPGLPILILSMHDEALYAQRALAAGARGYVMKNNTEQTLLQAAREVLAGNIYLSPHLKQQVSLDGANSSTLLLDLLTDRELEVFLLIGKGFAPRHIAEQLSLSVSTVEVYRERLKEKLDLRTSPLLVRYAVRWCKDQDIP